VAGVLRKTISMGSLRRKTATKPRPDGENHHGRDESSGEPLKRLDGGNAKICGESDRQDTHNLRLDLKAMQTVSGDVGKWRIPDRLKGKLFQPSNALF
jgi:hypothetical protein